MSFNSIQYFVFFAVVLVVYHRLGLRGQNRFMVVASAVFYGAFDWRFLFLLYTSVTVDFFVARRLAVTEAAGARKGLLAVSVCTQLGILGFFKYFNFFADSVTDLLGRFGLELSPFTLRVVLPVGISFYTFQTLAYVMAVYRRQVQAERDYVTFAAFVSWFPQLVAGPIERATTLLPQIRRHRGRPAGPLVESGVLLILQGLVKKVVIADSLAPFVTAVYTNPARHSWLTLMFATAGFAVQAYGDFSGYSDIARGSSRLLGVELRRNFEQPFLSRDIRELWQRWHTSLGSWFVEFVAQPLGGNRKGPTRAAINVLIVFTLIGLWHGAAWTFVFWGFFNGVLVVTWRYLPVPRGRHPMKLRLVEAPRIAFTFGLFCAGAVFFRAASFSDAFTAIRRMLLFRDGIPAPDGMWLVPIMMVVMVLIDLSERRRRINAIETLRVRANVGGVARPTEAVAESLILRMRSVPAGLTLAFMLIGLVIFSGGTPTPFIYFQF